jgi:hypothetical protein
MTRHFVHFKSEDKQTQKIIAIITCFATTGIIAPAGLGHWTGSLAIAGEGGGEGGGFANGGQPSK